MCLTRTSSCGSLSGMALTIREHVKRFATLMKGRSIVHANEALVRSAASALEGTMALVDVCDDKMQVPLTLTAEELRHFIAYVRALDNIARETQKLEKRCLVAETDERAMRIRLEYATKQIQELEREREESKKAAQGAARPRKRASRAKLIIRRAVAGRRNA